MAQYNHQCTVPIQEFQVNSFGVLIQKIADPSLLQLNTIGAAHLWILAYVIWSRGMVHLALTSDSEF